MIDPKMVEFSLYSKIEKHFLAKMESEDEPIVTDPRKAVYTLNSLCTEMDDRLNFRDGGNPERLPVQREIHGPAAESRRRDTATCPIS